MRLDLVMYIACFCFGLMHFKQKIINCIFSGKIVTSLAHNFTMEKAIFKIIFGIL